MGFLDRFRKAEEKPILTYAAFWEWFQTNEAAFRRAVQTKDSAVIEKDFFAHLEPKLHQLNNGIFYLVGMVDSETVDMIFTADGDPRNIPFAEELVAAAPPIPFWYFSPHKPPMDITAVGLRMNGITYDSERLSFFATDHEEMPDLVDITISHKDMNESNVDEITHGSYLFLDNYLGEINFLTTVDELSFCTVDEATKPLLPIEALDNYLQTRQALFVEKYDGVRIFTESDSYCGMEARLDSGRMLVATINADLLRWDRKASHPWMLVVTIAFDGEATNGMPDGATADRLDEIEDQISNQLKDADGYLNIGRQVANGERDIFYACIDFREPSKVVSEVAKTVNDLSVDYRIFKDKYWQSVAHFARSID